MRLNGYWFLCVSVAMARGLRNQPAESQELIDYVNNAKTTWKADRNFHENFKRSQVRRLLGHKKREDGESVLPIETPPKLTSPEVIPSSFDARDQWPNCTFIGHITDQSDCGSCWAVSAAAAFTDRLCIATKGRFTAQLSAAEVLSCCAHCGDGCDGGYDDMAWRYFRNHGIVTGGDYGSKDGCQPYPLMPCEHHVDGSRIPCDSLGDPATPACQRVCTNKHYKANSYTTDHHKTIKSYKVESTEKAIQIEIMKHGPVQAGFSVYTDFLSYKTGVYHHVAGDLDGGHAVKVIGWGVEDSTKYWLVANSWNTDWGDDGFFKILRGSDECGFESEISAGIPKWSDEQDLKL